MGELLEKSNLEIIEILVITREFPVPAVFKLAFDDVPIFVVFKAVPGNRCGYRGVKGTLGLAVVTTLC